MSAARANAPVCPLCDGACDGVDLAPLLGPDLMWLWDAVASAADRRGDEQMSTGVITMTTPEAAQSRAAAAGLLGGGTLAARQRRRVDLAQLTVVLARRGARLTPGSIAAHASGRRLATKARERALRAEAVDAVCSRLQAGLAALPPHVTARIETGIVERLHRTGWLTRISTSPNPDALVDDALAVLGRLPTDGERVDRRTLVPGDPHALDGGVLPALVLALAARSGDRPRAAWASLGVDIDDLVGGLIVTGLVPVGWAVPDGASYTLPPRELVNVRWAGPPVSGAWAFVTENPSVLAASATQFGNVVVDGVPPRVVCTVGTPSDVECKAIGSLADAGWQVAVRADFDPAGLAHVRALLCAAPTATAWRMDAEDYLSVDAGRTTELRLGDSDAPWAPRLIDAMRERSAPAFEEDLLDLLIADVARGYPPNSCSGRDSECRATSVPDRS